MNVASFSQKELAARLKETLDAHVWGTIGPESKAAASELANLLGREAALLCSSHAASVETVLRALEVSYGDEVILPALCSPLLKEAVEAVGAKCVFCDVDEFLTMDAKRLSFCFSDRTVAVFCEEIAGYVCDLPAIRAFTEEHDLPLIDVCAAPYCTRLSDKPTAQYADIAVALLPVMGVGALVTDAEFIGKLYAAHHCGNPYGQAGGLNTGVCLGGDMRVDEFRSTLVREAIRTADERRRTKNSVRIRLSEALLQDGAQPFPVRAEADSAGDFVLCEAIGRESCRDRADVLPYRTYTEAARIALAGVRAYRVI